MDIFLKAKSIRLRSHQDKYLTAEEEHAETITLTRDRSSPNTIWHVELIRGDRFTTVRLKSCHGAYLTASSTPFTPGFTGRLKVVQTRPYFYDPATKWEPLRDGMQIRLRSFFGSFLRPHGGLPPWRNSVTHDALRMAKTWDKMLWDVEVVEARTVGGGSARGKNNNHAIVKASHDRVPCGSSGIGRSRSWGSRSTFREFI